MTMPILGHLDPDFLGVMDDVMEMLRIVFKTSNKLTLPLSATGSAGMEAAFCNMVEPGDTVVVGINGYFGHRMADIASRCGADLHTVEFPWGRPIGPDLSPLEQEMKKHRSVKALGVVHGETSTGVLSPLPKYSRACPPLRCPAHSRCCNLAGGRRGYPGRVGTWTYPTAPPRNASERLPDFRPSPSAHGPSASSKSARQGYRAST